MKFTPAASERSTIASTRLLLQRCRSRPMGRLACAAEGHGAEADLGDEQARAAELIVAHGQISGNLVCTAQIGQGRTPPPYSSIKNSREVPPPMSGDHCLVASSTAPEDRRADAHEVAPNATASLVVAGHAHGQLGDARLARRASPAGRNAGPGSRRPAECTSARRWPGHAPRGSARRRRRPRAARRRPSAAPSRC